MTVRIAFCITELKVGGAEQCLVEVCTRINRDRFSPHVFSLAGPPSEGNDFLVQRLADSKVPVTFLGGRRYWQAPQLFIRLSRELRKLQPDIIQCFLFHANVLGVLSARRCRISNTVTGIRVADPRWWHSAVARQTLRSASWHVCVSESVARHWQQAIGVSPDKICVIPNGIDFSRSDDCVAIQPSSFGLSEKSKLIIFVGRLGHQKGIDRLIAAADQFLGPLPNHHLLIVGRGPLERPLQRNAQVLQCKDRIHWLGWRNDIPSLLKGSDLLVLPSRWEGMPNAVLEAMAAKRPVVAADVQGVRELLGENTGSQVADSEFSAQATDMIVAICRDDRLREELGLRNRLRAERDFSIETVVAAYEHLYENLIRRS